LGPEAARDWHRVDPDSFPPIEFNADSVRLFNADSVRLAMMGSAEGNGELVAHLEPEATDRAAWRQTANGCTDAYRGWLARDRLMSRC
jgi:hypothetical protein